jgi:hypothetical protein
MKGLQLIRHGLICFKLHYQFGNKSNTTSEESCTNSAYWFISVSLISTLFLLDLLTLQQRITINTQRLIKPFQKTLNKNF